MQFDYIDPVIALPLIIVLWSIVGVMMVHAYKKGNKR